MAKDCTQRLVETTIAVNSARASSETLGRERPPPKSSDALDALVSTFSAELTAYLNKASFFVMF